MGRPDVELASWWMGIWQACYWANQYQMVFIGSDFELEEEVIGPDIFHLSFSFNPKLFYSRIFLGIGRMN